MWVIFSIIVVTVYLLFNQKVNKIDRELVQLKKQLARANNTIRQLQLQVQISSSEHSDEGIGVTKARLADEQSQEITSNIQPLPIVPTIPHAPTKKAPIKKTFTSQIPTTQASAKEVLTAQNTLTEPDEQSFPIVTSVMHSFKNWFFGGNLVVRVGAIVLLMGVVLLLRLLSDYFETPIELKLLVIGLISLAVAGLGLKLVQKRFGYGITLQGVGLSAAYLTAFFAYQVYPVLTSFPSFMIMGTLSGITVVLALRQNAFPLALLAFSGAFLAPLLTSNDNGSLTVLFSYYLLLNVAIAIIAHYRPWKVLNLMGATVTFGLAYYWGFAGLLDAQINKQRLTLTTITVLHWLLYLFIAIRYAQQIIIYNQQQTHLPIQKRHTNTQDTSRSPSATKSHPVLPSIFSPILPIDTALMFATPLLAFGLFDTLLGDINNALTVTSAIMATVYLVAGFGFIKHKKKDQHTLIVEGMLALGFGFTALTIALVFDTNWTACGWSIQGLALVWFGRRVLRGWTILFGLTLQALAIMQLLSLLDSPGYAPSNLALVISALTWMAAMFVMRRVNPSSIKRPFEDSFLLSGTATTDNIKPSDTTQAQNFKQVNKTNLGFSFVLQSIGFITLLTFCGACWALIVNLYIVDDFFDYSLNDYAKITASIILLHLIIYWIIDRRKIWQEVSMVSRSLLCLFYVVLLWVLPAHYGFLFWTANKSQFILFIPTLIGGLIFAQLWIKRWQEDTSSAPLHSMLWLMTIVLLIMQFAYYVLPKSSGVMIVLLPTLCLITLTYAVSKRKLTLPAWYDWQTALMTNSSVFLPLLLGWVITANLVHDGIVWGMPYIPVFNLFDITVGVVLLYAIQRHRNATTLNQKKSKSASQHTVLLKAIGIIGFWVLSSILVRTLHAYADTPLWIDDAWGSDKVQTGLTILWTLTALIATFMSSRNGKRFWWFMGIGLLGLVVLKLVLVDLSQTDAIWRVVSFLVAGSLILVIGYLAPLPPDGKASDKKTPDKLTLDNNEPNEEAIVEANNHEYTIEEYADKNDDIKTDSIDIQDDPR